MSTRKIIPILIMLATITAYTLMPDSQLVSSGILYLFFPIASIIIAIYVSRIYRFNNPSGRSQILIAAGLACWGLGGIVEHILYSILNVEYLISLADFFYLLNVPLFGAGIYQGYVTANVKLRQVKKINLYALVLVSLILTGLVAYFGVYLAFDPTADALINTVNISYGVTDLIILVIAMLTILVAREYRGGKLSSFWTIITAGFFTFLVADTLYAMYPDLYEQGMMPYVLMDLLWIASSVLISYALLENYFHIIEVQNKIKAKLYSRING